MNLLYINFIVFNFFSSVFAYVCVCICICDCFISLCMYVLYVASILSPFVLSLFRLFLSKTIKVIHCYYLLKKSLQKGRKFAGGSFFRESNIFLLQLKVWNKQSHLIIILIIQFSICNIFTLTFVKILIEQHQE